MKLAEQKLNAGLLQCARYSFMPNRLRYCGGDKNSELFEYVVHQQSDQGLAEILYDFATLDPYLKLIAQSNNITDQYDRRVVEAYWLGNKLLDNVKTNKLYNHLIDEQQIKKRLRPEIWQQVLEVLPAGAKPHHSFHVFNIPKRTGHYPVEHTIKTMDECRISWGRIVSKPAGQKVIVQYQPLEFSQNQFRLGEPVKREVQYQFKDKSFVQDLRIGDWVSIHWGWVCEKLTPAQVKNLANWTKYHLALKDLSPHQI